MGSSLLGIGLFLRRRLSIFGSFSSFFLIVASLVLRQEPGALFIDAEGLHAALSGLFEQGLAALRAILGSGYIPGHEAAFLSTLTGIEGIALFGLALEHTAAALGAAAGHTLHQRLGVLALREARAGQELAEAAHFDDHLPAAELTDLVGLLLGHLQSDTLQCRLCILQLFFKILVKIRQQILPVLLSRFHSVQTVFHIGSEAHVYNILEALLHESCNHLAQGCGCQALILLDHIIPVLNGGNGGSIGRGAANTLLLHGLDQGRLGKTGRGLGKVLLLVQACSLGLLALAQIGQRRAQGLTVIVPALLIDGNKAGEAQALVGGAEGVPRAGRIDGHGVIQGVCHLAGQEPAPDKLIQPVLVRCQAAPYPLRVQLYMGWPDGLVGILGFCLGLVHMELAIVILLTVAIGDKIRSGSHCLIAKPQGIGTHIGNEAQGSLTLHIYAFVELLGDHHGLLGSHVQLPGSLLLQGRGGEGRCGGPLLLRLLHVGNGEGLAGNIGNDSIGLGLILQLPFLFLTIIMGHKGAGLLQPVQRHIKAPVFLWLEGPDLLLPVHHHPGGNALDTSGGKPSANLFPQQGRELIAHDPVQNPAGLLGIHQVIVDIPGMLDGVLDHLLGDLVEGDPVGLLLRELQELL